MAIISYVPPFLPRAGFYDDPVLWWFAMVSFSSIVIVGTIVMIWLWKNGFKGVK